MTKLQKFLLTASACLICGCQSGLYRITTSEDGKELDSKMNYSEVSSLSTEVEFDQSRMPVEIVYGRENRMADEPGVSVMLCFFSLGIFPMVQTESVTQDITVKTPIGIKSGTWRVDAKRWTGWVPLFIGYPSSADERDADAKLPNPKMEQKAKDMVVDSLAREFSYDAYASFANKKNNERQAECDHIAEVRRKINDLMAENKYDAAEQLRSREAVKRSGTWACDAAIWQELKETILKNSVLTMNDPSRLVSLFSMVNDLATKDAIIIKLGKLGKCSLLGDATLVKHATEFSDASSEEGRLSAVAAIGSEKELIVIAKAKYSKAITIAAFKKLSPDKLRAAVFATAPIDEELASWYIDVYGTDREVANSIQGIEASKLAEEIIKDVCKSRYHYDFAAIVKRLKEIKDRSLLEAVAAEILKRDMQSHEGRIDYDTEEVLRNDIFAFTSFLPVNECERLFDKCNRRSFPSSLSYDSDGNNYGVIRANDFLIGLLQRMPKAMFQRKLKAVESRLAEVNKISFEGFYCGMPWKDYCVMCIHRKCVPRIKVNGNVVTRLVFNRTARYKLFEQDDGEFWSAFLRKYVPSKKSKSLTDTIGDALDRGTFDYQEGPDNKLKEYCYIYKSMKYGTRVLFGQKSGTLVLEEYK